MNPRTPVLALLAFAPASAAAQGHVAPVSASPDRRDDGAPADRRAQAPEGADQVLQINTGNGPYIIYAARDLTSEKLGYVVVTGDSPPPGYLANTEHFIWLDTRVVWPADFYLYLGREPLSGLLAQGKHIDRYNNRISCKTSRTKMVGADRWEARITWSTRMHVATLIRGDNLLGYWVSDTTCKAVAPGVDGWIDLVRGSALFTPRSWGTPTR